eukprot:m.79065 g.79065  ORF g.79065 m.79065 type:complete len:163 (+) comp50620_c0_seq1:112-600(+)
MERGGQYISGYHCIATKSDCVGDNQDALYMEKSHYAHLGGKDIHVIVGLNHNATGKAVYSNIALYLPGATGVPTAAAVLENSQYAGSADSWAPNLDNVDKAYVVTIEQHCPPDSPYCIDASKAGASADEATYIARAYLEEATRTGPSPAEILPPTFLHFTKI